MQQHLLFTDEYVPGIICLLSVSMQVGVVDSQGCCLVVTIPCLLVCLHRGGRNN